MAVDIAFSRFAPPISTYTDSRHKAKGDCFKTNCNHLFVQQTRGSSVTPQKHTSIGKQGRNIIIIIIIIIIITIIIPSVPQACAQTTS